MVLKDFTWEILGFDMNLENNSVLYVLFNSGTYVYALHSIFIFVF